MSVKVRRHIKSDGNVYECSQKRQTVDKCTDNSVYNSFNYSFWYLQFP